MNKAWASPPFFIIAIWLLLSGYNTQQKGERDFTLSSPFSREPSRIQIQTGHFMMIGGGISAVLGLVFVALGAAHRKIQIQTLNDRLNATYTFVSVIPAEGFIPEVGMMTEDQAADLLKTSYPSLATKATETLRREFAEKRRLEPSKIWFVKDFLVREVATKSA